VPDPSFLPQKFLVTDQPFILNFQRKIPEGITLITTQHFLLAPSPFVHPFSIQRAAAYRLNDKFTLSGNSFAGNSIFNPLLPNPDLRNMSIRGASMFLQYKISKNVRVGGGFSVTSH